MNALHVEGMHNSVMKSSSIRSKGHKNSDTIEVTEKSGMDMTKEESRKLQFQMIGSEKE